MRIDFEKYFQGELNEEERRRLEQELAENTELKAQFEQDQDFLEQLETQLLREKVKAAMAGSAGANDAPAPTKGRSLWWLLAVGVAALLIAWAVWNPFSNGPSPVTPVAPNAPPSTTWPAGEAAPAAPETAPEAPAPTEQPRPANPPGRPIAETLPDPVEAHALEGVRGESKENSPWQALVEKVWYAPLPGKVENFPTGYRPALQMLKAGKTMDAFMALEELGSSQPANDTLSFLKGYCLMQLWEGREALRLFDSLQGKPHPWQSETAWYRGLCYLVMGQKEQALGVFRQVAGRPGSAFAKRAKEALKDIR
ncbi:MAG: hypothetical protein H6577_00345 [Lewinellaceae bacterium]|nr:hypothetical protein [Saprospiraceae bacterium]MCB9336558.1 hypothetical protein [Lewinellaceae bacterium]